MELKLVCEEAVRKFRCNWSKVALKRCNWTQVDKIYDHHILLGLGLPTSSPLETVEITFSFTGMVKNVEIVLRRGEFAPFFCEQGDPIPVPRIAMLDSLIVSASETCEIGILGVQLDTEFARALISHPEGRFEWKSDQGMFYTRNRMIHEGSLYSVIGCKIAALYRELFNGMTCDYSRQQPKWDTQK